jgi:hypothetical protein
VTLVTALVATDCCDSELDLDCDCVRIGGFTSFGDTVEERGAEVVVIDGVVIAGVAGALSKLFLDIEASTLDVATKAQQAPHKPCHSNFAQQKEQEVV